MTLVDTNIIVDILTSDPAWLNWSAQNLARCRDEGALRVNEITYGELAVRIETEADLQRILAQLDIDLERTPTPALFTAGKAFGRYRAAGGARTSLLPDFLIGAHAQFARLPVLTRDARRYRNYFPDVELIAP
jgi:predicted nucleic acid-binding protein